MLHFLPSRANSNLASLSTCIGLPLAAANLTVIVALVLVTPFFPIGHTLFAAPETTETSTISRTTPTAFTSLNFQIIVSQLQNVQLAASTRTRCFVRFLQSCMSLASILNGPVVAIFPNLTEPVPLFTHECWSTRRGDLHAVYRIRHEQLHESHMIHHLPSTLGSAPQAAGASFFFTINVCPELGSAPREAGAFFHLSVCVVLARPCLRP